MEMRLLAVMVVIFLALGVLSLSFSSVMGGLTYLFVLSAIILIVAKFAGEASAGNSEMEMV